MDEAIGVCSDSAYRLFTGLISLSDDYGRHKGDPRLLSSLIWPYQSRPAEAINEYLTELEGHGLIIRYFHSGQPFVALPTWSEHQRIDNAGKEKIPSPEEADGIQAGSPDFPDSRKSAASRRESPRSAAGGDQGEDQGPRIKESAKIADAPLSNLLADLIEKNTGRRPRPGKRWVDAERLLFDRDGRDPVQAERLLRWSQNDEFWRSNILSMPKFRAKYDQLLLTAKRKGGGRQAAASTAERRGGRDQHEQDLAWAKQHLPDVPPGRVAAAIGTLRLGKVEITVDNVRGRLAAGNNTVKEAA